LPAAVPLLSREIDPAAKRKKKQGKERTKYCPYRGKCALLVTDTQVGRSPFRAGGRIREEPALLVAEVVIPQLAPVLLTDCL
jgi:hypothetical protein